MPRTKSKNGYGVAYGKLKSLDKHIANMSVLHTNPYKRYFLKALTAFSDGYQYVNQYYPNLAAAREEVAKCPQRYAEVTEQDLQDELTVRYREAYTKVEGRLKDLGLTRGYGLQVIHHHGVPGLFIPLNTNAEGFNEEI